jgi:cytochrome c biogenesis protein CcdA
VKRGWLLPRLLLLLLPVSVLLLITPAFSFAQSENEPVARVIIFYSPTCPHCYVVLHDHMPGIQARYGSQLETRLYNIAEPEGLYAYQALHDQFPQLPGGVPQAYIANHLLVGSAQIPEELPQLIDACLAQGGCDWSFTFTSGETQPAPAASHDAETVFLAYCYDPSCVECDRVSYELDHLESQFPNLQIARFNIFDDAPTIEAMCRRYDVPAANRLQAPSVFIGDVYLSPDEINLTRLTALIEEMSVAGSAQPWAELDDAALGTATQNITERFAGWGVLAIVGAGLLDGVNPCAFATIIFFISYLAISGRTGNQIIMVGSAFTFAVFLTYTALGLGLSTLVEELGGSSVVGRVIYGATALVCVLFAGLSLWDYRKIRQGKLTEIALQLPKSLKKRIHATIRKRTRVKGFIGAAFIAGMLVSLFELACTGQVYLPTIVFMTSVTEWRTTAIAYLILYNLMFVIPLIAVFAVAYYGASSDNLTAYFQTHVGAVKLLTAALFGALALWLMYILQIG